MIVMAVSMNAPRDALGASSPNEEDERRGEEPVRREVEQIGNGRVRHFTEGAMYAKNERSPHHSAISPVISATNALVRAGRFRTTPMSIPTAAAWRSRDT